MTLVRPWRLPLGKDSLTQLLETLRERYHRRSFGNGVDMGDRSVNAKIFLQLTVNQGFLRKNFTHVNIVSLI
jgi:hypothetical protein